MPEVTIPPEVTPENVTTYIVDSGGLFTASLDALFARADPNIPHTFQLDLKTALISNLKSERHM